MIVTRRPSRPSQIDLHIHAGQERAGSLEDLVNWLIMSGTNFLGLLDHSELYQLGDERLRRNTGRAVYSSSKDSLEAFFSSIEKGRQLQASEAFIFKGLEVPEWDLRFVKPSFVASADFLGVHLNTSCGGAHASRQRLST